MDEVSPAPEVDESAHTTTRKSARSPRVEIITRGERRRTWTLREKQEIVAESLGPDLTPTEVARKHAISTGQLYTWRHQLLRMQRMAVSRTMPRFAEVEFGPAGVLPSPSDPGSSEASPRYSSLASTRSAGLIEVILPNGVRVRTDTHVDARALRRVLGALRGR